MSDRRDDDFRIRPSAPKNRGQGFVSKVLKQAGKASSGKSSVRRPGGAGKGAGTGHRPGSRLGRGHTVARFAGAKLTPLSRRVTIKTLLVNQRQASPQSLAKHLRYIERDGVGRDGEPGRWPVVLPLPAVARRRTEDLPLLALPVCWSTLAMKPWPRFFGALGRMRKSSSRRLLMALLPEGWGVGRRAKHADKPVSARASRPQRHGGAAAPCRATPTCRLALRADRCRPLLSCLPHLPPAFAPGNRGPVALLPEQSAPRRTRRWPQAGRVRGKTSARGTAVRSAGP